MSVKLDVLSDAIDRSISHNEIVHLDLANVVDNTATVGNHLAVQAVMSSLAVMVGAVDDHFYGVVGTSEVLDVWGSIDGDDWRLNILIADNS